MTTGHPTPSGPGSGDLAGLRVLVPRGGEWGSRVTAAIAARGGDPVLAPLIESARPLDVAALDDAVARLNAGHHAWLFVTSAQGIEALATAGARPPAATRLAVVGPATAAAARHAGWPVAFVPAGTSSAESMVAQWCPPRDPAVTGRCLVVRSDLARPYLADSLALRGFDVEVCIGYRTIGVDLDPVVAADLRAGGIDAVLLTSLSVARELRRQVPAPAATVRYASIGPGTTSDAEALGYDVSVTSAVQTVDALLDAVAAGIHPPDTDPAARAAAPHAGDPAA